MSGTQLVHTGGASGAANIYEPGSEDPFETVFAPAKSVLDAIIEMWGPLRWLHRQQQSQRTIFDPKQAGKLIDLVPPGHRIAKAGGLYLEAEEISAPEAWVHVAIGLMLQEAGASVSDAYRCAITDGAFRDPEIWGSYEPGFSAAVIVRTIREVRLKGAIPSTGGFLNLCAKQRAQFKSWRADTSTLLEVRYAAEDVLEQSGVKLLEFYDQEDAVPF
jgi:hypothetical protein